MDNENLEKKQYKVYKSVLFYSIIFLVICIIGIYIIQNLGYAPRRWVEIVITCILNFSLIIGIGQLIYDTFKDGKKNREKYKNQVISGTAAVIFLAIIIVLIKYKIFNQYDERIIEKANGEKIVEIIEHIWLDPDRITEYKYKDIFLRESKAIEKEKNDIPPIIDDIVEEKPKEIIVEEENVELKVEYEDELIVVEYMGSVLGQKSVYRVVKSNDEGKTWEYQCESLTLNNEAKFTNINGKIFVNNLGIISYGSQNSILLVSEDRGIRFEEAKIEDPEEIFVQEIEDVPYLVDNIYEFRTTDYDGNELKFQSEDGIEWKLAM